MSALTSGAIQVLPAYALVFLILSNSVTQKQIMIYAIAFGPTICFAKLSLLLLYLRIFSLVSRVRCAIYIGIFLNIMFYAGSTVAYGALCIPSSGQSWADTLNTGRCIHSNVVNYLQAAFGVLSDFYILILPMPIVYKMKLPFRKKVGVAAIFATGLL